MRQSKILLQFISTLAATATLSLAHADAPTYHNMFLSYYTPKNIQSMVDYINTDQLGGFILWEFRGDTAVTSADSLLSAANTRFNVNPAHPPMIMGYWSNWSVYTNDAVHRAIPEPAYRVPGSTSNETFQVEQNPDFTAKLEKMNVITYAFVEAQAITYTNPKDGKKITNPHPEQIGTLYFNDPWSDLLPDDAFCNNNPVCLYAPRMQGQADNAKTALMGNFVAFSKLAHQEANNVLGPLKKTISIGGYGHDDTFEDMFAQPVYEDNFVNSAASIVSNYKLDGIDLDYENPSMTHANSIEFTNLVKKLRAKLGDNTLITVTILSGTDYLKGTKGGLGFADGTLQQLATIADHINVMTYDMHGAFDYVAGKESGRTGFITNLVMPNAADMPPGYDPMFSVVTSVDALKAMNIPANKINVGAPAYGRALTNIASDNGGLFQLIKSDSIIPRGDLDAADCSQGLPLTDSACSGSFQYRYIVENMRGKGFVETNHDALDKNGQTVANGTTAFASSWSPVVKQSHSLEITNTGAGTDLGFQISVHDAGNTHHFGLSDWLNPGADKVYGATTNPNTTDIDGLTNLTVHWEIHWPDQTIAGDCPGTFNFTQNMHVMVKVDAQKHTLCDIKPLS